MLIIPLPTYLVDFLIGLNIVLAILVFMGSFYIERILSFSTFPSVFVDYDIISSRFINKY
nr:FHIPEP family type III secretion protein [Shigella flexneri]